MSDHLLQALILAMGAIGAYGISRADNRRWMMIGFAVCCAAEPVWLYVLATQGQWGMALLCLWYAWCYGRGYWRVRNEALHRG